MKNPFIVALTNGGKMKKCIIMIILMLALIVSGCGGQWLVYSDSPIPGKVVDADTGKTLEGALVIGLWAYTDMFGGGHGGFANIEVVESNKDGDFRIPAWIWFNPFKLIYFVEDSEPLIVIFKPGYRIHTHRKNWITGIDNPVIMTDKEKAEAVIKHGIMPARLIKLLSDKEKIENIKELRSITFLSEWPIMLFDKNKLKKSIIDEIDTLGIENIDKQKLINVYK